MESLPAACIYKLCNSLGLAFQSSLLSRLSAEEQNNIHNHSDYIYCDVDTMKLKLVRCPVTPRFEELISCELQSRQPGIRFKYLACSSFAFLQSPWMYLVPILRIGMISYVTSCNLPALRFIRISCERLQVRRNTIVAHSVLLVPE